MADKESLKQKTYGKSVYIKLAVLAAVLIVFDQLMKYAAVVKLKGNPPFILIRNVLELHYLENKGAAFGLLQNKQIFFSVITVLFIAASIFIIVKIPKNRYFLPCMLTVCVLFSGALGNFIDRLVHKYVVDFIYFSIIDFPVFNVADIYVTLSVITFVVLLLFKYKDNDFDFLKISGKNGK